MVTEGVWVGGAMAVRKLWEGLRLVSVSEMCPIHPSCWFLARSEVLMGKI